MFKMRIAVHLSVLASIDKCNKSLENANPCISSAQDDCEGLSSLNFFAHYPFRGNYTHLDVEEHSDICDYGSDHEEGEKGLILGESGVRYGSQAMISNENGLEEYPKSDELLKSFDSKEDLNQIMSPHLVQQFQWIDFDKPQIQHVSQIDGKKFQKRVTAGADSGSGPKKQPDGTPLVDDFREQGDSKNEYDSMQDQSSNARKKFSSTDEQKIQDEEDNGGNIISEEVFKIKGKARQKGNTDNKDTKERKGDIENKDRKDDNGNKDNNDGKKEESGMNQNGGMKKSGPVKADITTGEYYPILEKEEFSIAQNFWSSDLESRFQKGFESSPNLKVIVVPFSHNDAAWLRTFDEYYNEKSRKILDSLAKELPKHKDMTFVWSEICFLSRWWKNASRQLREDFLDLVRTNRIEICPGGWVMADEACPHVFALLVELTEGHLWVKDNLGVLPKVGWSIDPFGHSGTMAYLLQEAGLTQGSVIQRIHYGWKSIFAKQKAGDFIWKQDWDEENKHGLLTHNLPFNIYSTTSSCGPHPEVCRQFDFNLSSAAPITFSNVKMKTELLLSEYWRTGSLFPHNVVLAPLGDDFRFTNCREFAAQYKNYKALMDYSGSDKKLRTEMSFGTPSDYFRAVQKRQCGNYPVLSGDFFPYADYDECGAAYWSGYYATRPHHKKLSRVAEWNLRSAEILFTFAFNIARQNRMEHENLRRLYRNLIAARRQVSLFQHHDGITGTSKAYVMEDFRNRLIEANTNSILVQSGSIQYILGSADRDFVNYSPTNLTPFSIIIKEQDLASSTYMRIIPGHTQKIVIFNSLGIMRQEILKIVVSNPCIDIIDTSCGKPIIFQVNPVWYVHKKALYQPSNFPRVYVKKTEFELVLVLNLEPLSVKVLEVSEFCPDKCCFLQTFMKKAQDEEEGCDGGVTIPPNFKRPHHFASVYSLTAAIVKTFGIFTTKIIQVDWLVLENSEMVVQIDRDSGFVSDIRRKDTNETFKVELNYHAYESHIGRSGAYLFKPTGNQTSPNCTEIEFMVIHGPVITECILIFHGLAQHTIRIFHIPGPLSEVVQIENMVNLATSGLHQDVELFMKLKTTIKNGEQPVFYTDSNGFKIEQRQKVDGLGTETNYYPSTTCAFIQDERYRLSVLHEQSHGISSNIEGQLEVMLDRRIKEDDNRGMGEGLMDSRKSIFSFHLLLEQIKDISEKPARPTLLAHTLIDMQTYPINVFYAKPNFCMKRTLKFISLLNNNLPCDVRIVNLRTYSHPNTENYPLNSALMTIHRRAFVSETAISKSLERTCTLTPTHNSSSALLKGTRFKHMKTSDIKYVSLTGLHEYDKIPSLDLFCAESFEMKSMRVTFK